MRAKQLHTEVKCLGCRRLLANEEAMLVFRTGFCGDVPVGGCEQCVAMYPPLNRMWRVRLTDLPYDSLH
ncbi:diaminopimelate decarboxylase [Paenibacillus thiaminolyticus]|uniref:diaminopimelate decarboxylase n=1 Tax=Paenibacillus thiaminolyticus TaxID=49283 RepID=UPI002543549E|nr:diaminopimelate decarboxylase [Paenibacillus thiaminolyticus]WII36885.1 diaminopimelate decarboxylase [Paenibacillus thiaminolyticus]